MPAVFDLIRLLADPNDADALDRAFGEPEPLDIDDALLPHEDDRPYLLKEVVCNELADLGPEAREAIPALLRCAENMTGTTVARFMRLSAARAVWKVSRDPSLYIPICERLLLDRECWLRRQVVELLDEFGHPAALPALQGRLADVRPEVRQAARKAIQKIKGHSPTQ